MESISEQASYLFPRYGTEIDRLDVQHYALRQARRGNYSSPLRRPSRILDVGCGTGQWAYDLCQEFPASLVVGLDLVPSKPGRPRNFAFVHGNVLQGLPFEEGSFDFVHQRLLAASGVPLRSWTAVVADLVRVTRPDGWIELVEAAPEIQRPGPATERLFGMVRKLGQSLGLDTTSIIVRSLRRYLEQAGMVDVRSEVVAQPIGEWGGRAGSLLASAVRAGMTNLTDRFAQRLGVPEHRSRELIRAMGMEWDEFRSQSRFAVACGRRPS